jgi:hypothetical protein
MIGLLLCRASETQHLLNVVILKRDNYVLALRNIDIFSKYHTSKALQNKNVLFG